jgi:hypothetical protein
MSGRPLSTFRPPGEVLFAVLACAFLATAAWGAAPTIEEAAAQTEEGGIEFRVLESTSERTLVEIDIPAVVAESISVEGRTHDLLSVPGAYPYGEPGEPLLAVGGTFIAVPPASGVALRVLEESSEVLAGLDLPPLSAVCREPGEAVVYDSEAYARPGFFPKASIAVGEPAIMRDFRVVPLRVYPLSYDATTGEVRVTTRLLVELDYSSPGSVNVKTRMGQPTKGFAAIYENLIANYEFVRPRYESDQRGKYIIITHDNYYSTILPLADWKHKRGMDVEIAKISQIGSNTSSIKNYLQNAYDNWDVPPDYVLIVGDSEYVPTSDNDNYYGRLEGGDYLVDVHIGRLTADSVSQCQLFLDKTMGYEHTPYMANLDWFRSGTLIINDDSPSDPNYWADSQLANDYMEAADFVQIDWFVDTYGHNQNDVHAAVTEGRVLLMYRGQGVSNWWSPFACNPNQTNPGYKLPVVMSATCASGNFTSDGYPGENWMRAGSVGTPKGSVGFLGTSIVASHVSHYRSAVAQGFWTGLFSSGNTTIGAALTQGKYNLYLMYNHQYEYNGWNCQGDPELDVWTAIPAALEVSHAATVPANPNDFTVEVTIGGSPVRSALVCVWSPDGPGAGEVYEYGFTNNDGLVTLSISPLLSESLLVTVSGHNLHPHEGTVDVVPEGAYLVYAGHETDDGVEGNGDGLVSPGETIHLSVDVENIGPDDALGVTALLSVDDEHVTVTDATADYGTIPSGAIRPNGDPLVFEVDAACPDGHPILFSFDASDAGRASWGIAIPEVVVSAGDLGFVSAAIDDGAPGGNGNGNLEIGETAWIDVTIENTGALDLDLVQGVLSTPDSHAAVTQDLGYFGPVTSGGSATNETHSFRVSVSPSAPISGEVSFVLATSGDGGTYAHAEDVTFALPLAGAATQQPSGPDGYGYHAYDATDTWTGQAPVYDWVEISGVGEIMPEITDADAEITQRDLPFTFRYYGTDYTQVSVNSNGFLAMGYSDYRFGDNSLIPSGHGPAAMVAPFWDDLNAGTTGGGGGDIYEWYDSANERYIVEFDAVQHYGGGFPETFEVIFYNPAVYPTTTGDGVIVIQYKTVSAPWLSTTGIENAAQTIGIQYLHNGVYDEAAAPLAAGQAIKFTTEGPIDPTVWLVAEDSWTDDTAGGDGDHLNEPGETIDITALIANMGSSTATGVVGTISSSDPDVTIDSDTASFGDIGAGGSSPNASPFVVTISGAPSDETIEFDLHLSSTSSRDYDTWEVITITLTLDGTGIDEPDEVPLAFALRQNAPNPFRNGTRIAFILPTASRASLEVYNVAGRKVASVVDREFAAGAHSVAWDGRDSGGREVPAGIYFYRLEAGENESMKKLIVLR